MYRFSPITLTELERTAVLCKFLYFLRDIGIESAHEPGVAAWVAHMDLLSDMAGYR